MSQNDPRPVAIALMGPTAAGKTALSLEWAAALDAEIVSVDSALVYRGLDIGAAKPDAAERAGVPHHLIDIREPSQPYSAADFAVDARAAVEAIVSRGRLPILAAIMSTLSCQLLVCSSALTEDLYRGFLRRNAGQRELVWVGRAAVLGVALLAIFIARDPESRVLGLVSYAWAGFGAAFGPVVLISLFWSRMTRNGALAGMVAGAATVIVWETLFAESTGLYSMVPGFAIGCVAIVLGSLLGRAPSPAMAARHLQVRAALDARGY